MCPWGTFSYAILPFGLCNAPATFQRVVISIFFDIFANYLEVYMDDFTTYGKTFEEAKENLDKVLQRCKDYNLSLNSEKYFMMMQGVVLGHFISPKGIKVDPTKIEVIRTLAIPTKLKKVKIFLGHVGYYGCFYQRFQSNCSTFI